jgi:hypothetical protein
MLKQRQTTNRVMIICWNGGTPVHEDCYWKIFTVATITVWIATSRKLKLPIEVGGWCRIVKENRLCTFCLKNIGDELHV